MTKKDRARDRSHEQRNRWNEMMHQLSNRHKMHTKENKIIVVHIHGQNMKRQSVCNKEVKIC